MVQLLDRQHLPHAALRRLTGDEVRVRRAAGTAGGDGVHEPVVRQPVGRHGAARAPHRGRKRPEQRRHGRVGLLVVREQARQRPAAGDGKIPCVRQRGDARIERARTGAAQVVKGVVARRKRALRQHAQRSRRDRLVRVAADAELVEPEVIHALERRNAERARRAEKQRRERACGIRLHVGKRRPVVRRGDGHQRVHPAGLAAGEQRRGRLARGLGRLHLLGAAVREQLHEQPRRRTAEAVPDEIYGPVHAPAGHERRGICRAEARVAEALRVRDAVVGGAAGERGVELARAVPRARDDAHRGRAAVIPAAVEIAEHVARREPPVGHGAVERVLRAPAEQPVHEHGRVRAAAAGRRIRQQARAHFQRLLQQLLRCFHGAPPSG